MEKGKFGDCCPACGVPSKMFEPFDDKVSPFRKLLLNLHIHPVVVHMPQAFAFFIVGCAAVSFLFQGDNKEDLISTVRILSIVMPFSIIAAFITGIMDGKIRFRKVTTPILKTKIAAGTGFFILSSGAFAAVIAKGMTANTIIIVIALNAAGLVCSAILGKLGAGILDSKFPG